MVAGLRHQRQTLGIELEVRDGLLAILAACLKGRRALHMRCIGHRGLYRATGRSFRVFVHGERRYGIVEAVLCIPLEDETRRVGVEMREEDGGKEERWLEIEVIKKCYTSTIAEAASRISRLLGSGMGCHHRGEAFIISPGLYCPASGGDFGIPG